MGKSVGRLLAILVCFLLIPYTPQAFAQCEIEEINRPDGTIAKRVIDDPSSPMAYNDYMQMFLDAIAISDEYYVTGIFRWKEERRKLTGDIEVILEDGSAIKMAISEKRKIEAGGSNVTTILYSLDNTDIEKLQNSNIDIINIKIGYERKMLRIGNETNYLKDNISCLVNRSHRPEINRQQSDELNELINHIENVLKANISINKRTGSIESYYGGYSHEVNAIELDKESINAKHKQYTNGGIISISCKEKENADSEYLSFTPRKKCVSVYGSIESPVDEKSFLKITTKSSLFRPRNEEAVFSKLIESLNK